MHQVNILDACFLGQILKPSMLHLLFIKHGGYQAVGLFLVHLGNIAGGDTGIAVGAINGPQRLGKVINPFCNTVIVHFYKIAFPHFLVVAYKGFAWGATYCQYVTAPYLFAIGVGV